MGIVTTKVVTCDNCKQIQVEDHKVWTLGFWKPDESYQGPATHGFILCPSCVHQLIGVLRKANRNAE